MEEAHREDGSKASRVLEPERLLMMAIELDHAPDGVWDAIDRLAESGLSKLLDILAAAPHSSWVASDAWHRAITHDRLRSLVDAEPPDLGLLEQVLAGIGAADAGVLLDLLTESDSLSTRRRLFSRLTELAPDIGTEIVRRLSDERWFARRNMLQLLGEFTDWPRRWSPLELSEDPHPAVRRESFKLLLRVPEHRDRALCGLLADTDRRAMSLGLAAATESCPPEGIDLLAAIVRDESVSPELRVMGVRALGLTGSAAAVVPMTELIQRGSGLVRRRLAEKSPVMLAALQALSAFAGDLDAETRRLLSRAARSDDPAIRDAVGRS